VCLWRLPDRTLLWAVNGHASGVLSVACSADGRLIASSDADETVRLWEASTGWPTASLIGHTGTVGGAIPNRGDNNASGGGCARRRRCQDNHPRSTFAALEARLYACSRSDLGVRLRCTIQKSLAIPRRSPSAFHDAPGVTSTIELHFHCG
jgi:WD40 repeat protein